MVTISIGVPAYNEEGNIGKLLGALCEQRFDEGVVLGAVVVVASGCTDRTVEIVEGFCRDHNKIKLITEDKKSGKARAINHFMGCVDSDILVLESADTIPEKGAINELVKPFCDERVGLVGGRPVPVNSDRSIVGFAVHLIWELHHEIALVSPKAGECIAFRNIFDSMPTDTATDEACLEAMIKARGYKLHYSPDAVFYNKGPETISDLIKQRVRIHIGHIHLAHVHSYRPSTTGNILKIKYILKKMKQHPFNIPLILAAVFMEGYSMASAMIKFYVLGKNPYNWETVSTTKDLDKR